MVEECALVNGGRCFKPEIVVADVELAVPKIGFKMKLPLCSYHAVGGRGYEALFGRVMGGLGSFGIKGAVEIDVIPREEFRELWNRVGLE